METCGVLHERSEELGDNGGCEGPVDYTCSSCGLPVCAYHAWFLYVVSGGQKVFCSPCAGVSGFERAAQHSGTGGAGR